MMCLVAERDWYTPSVLSARNTNKDGDLRIDDIDCPRCPTCGTTRDRAEDGISDRFEVVSTRLIGIPVSV